MAKIINCSLILILLTTSSIAQDKKFSLVKNDSATSLNKPDPPQIRNEVAESSKIKQKLETPKETARFALASAEQEIQNTSNMEEYEIPPLEIGGIDTYYPLGEAVQVWAKPILEKPEFLKSVAYSWTVLPSKKIIIWPDSTRVIFGAGVENTSYTIILTASYVYVKPNKDGELIIAQRAIRRVSEVKVGDGSQIPSNPDDPQKPQDPDLAGLSKNAYDWTAYVEKRPDYSESDLKKDAAVLASNFTQISKDIESGELVSISDILSKTKSINDGGAINRGAWLPWFTKMSQFLQNAFNSGTIKTPQQFSSAWKEISQGLLSASQ